MDLQLSNPIISQSASARSAAAPGTESQNGKLQDAAAADSASSNFAKILAQALPAGNGRMMPKAVKVPGAKDQISGGEADPAAGGAASITLSSPTSSALPAIASADDQKTIRSNPRLPQDTTEPGIEVSGPILANFMPAQQTVDGAASITLSSPMSSALPAANADDRKTIRTNSRPVQDTTSGPILANFMPAQQAAGAKIASDSESMRLPASPVNTPKSASSNATSPDTAAQLSADQAQATQARPASALQTGHNSTIEATALQGKQAIQATDFNAAPADRIAPTLPSTPPPRSEAIPVQHLEIPAPLGNHDWNNQLGQRVVWMSSQQNQIAEIRINPPELGPIELRLTLDNQQSAQNATLHFVSPHAEVRSAIENSMSQLRVLMADAGITLGNATVSGESLPRQQASGQEPATEKNPASQSSGKSGAIEAASPSPSASRGNALLDTFA